MTVLFTILLRHFPNYLQKFALILLPCTFYFSEEGNNSGKVGHSRTRGTVVFFDLFKNWKTLDFKDSMVINLILGVVLKRIFP